MVLICSSLMTNKTCQKKKKRLVPGGLDSKASAYNVGNPSSTPELGRCSGEGNGNPLQYSWLENPMNREHGRLQSMGSERVEHDWVTSLHFNDQWGFPGGVIGKESAYQCRSCRFDPWVRKTARRRKWQPLPEFLPGKFHGHRNLPA